MLGGNYEIPRRRVGATPVFNIGIPFGPAGTVVRCVAIRFRRITISIESKSQTVRSPRQLRPVNLDDPNPARATDAADDRRVVPRR
jgi:hypothetical protein